MKYLIEKLLKERVYLSFFSLPGKALAEKSQRDIKGSQSGRGRERHLKTPPPFHTLEIEFCTHSMCLSRTFCVSGAILVSKIDKMPANLHLGVRPSRIEVMNLNWVWIPAQPLVSYVSLDKQPNISVIWCSHLRNGDDAITSFIGLLQNTNYIYMFYLVRLLWTVIWLMPRKDLEKFLAYNEYMLALTWWELCVAI